MKHRKLIVLVVSLLGVVTLVGRAECSLNLNQFSISNAKLSVDCESSQYMPQGDAIGFPRNEPCTGCLAAHFLYQLGLTYQLTGQDALAVNAFRSARVIDPHYLVAYFNEGRVLSSTGQLDEAISVWQQGDAASYFVSLGAQALKIGDLPTAEANLKLAVQIDPSNYLPYTKLGSVYRLAKNWKQATEVYHRALILKPDDLDANYHLGVTLLALNQLSDARAYAEKALKLNPDYVWAYILLGDTYRLEKDYTAAERWYRTAQDITKEKDLASKYLGLTALEKNDPVSALQYFSQIAPDSGHVSQAERHALFGAAYAQSELYLSSLQELEAAIQLEPDNVTYHLELARVYRAVSRRDAARAIYLRVLQIEPGNLSAKLGLEQLDTEQ